MKDVVAFTVYVFEDSTVFVTFRFRGTVHVDVCDPGHNVCQVSSCGSSPSWELDFFFFFIDSMFDYFDYLQSNRVLLDSSQFTSTLYRCEIISSSQISLRAGNRTMH